MTQKTPATTPAPYILSALGRVHDGAAYKRLPAWNARMPHGSANAHDIPGFGPESLRED